MKKILQKVLSELQKDKPDLSYIRGLLEGLVEEDSTPATSVAVGREREALNWLADNNKIEKRVGFNPDGEIVSIDETSILDAQARSALETVKKLSQQG